MATPESAQANRAAVVTGLKDRQRVQVLDAMTLLSGPFTSAEIAKTSELDRHAVARRLPELMKEGRVRKCGARTCMVSGLKAETWEMVK